MEELSIQQTFDLCFRNKEFLITVRVHKQRLYLQVEDKYEGMRWTGTFMAEYIEHDLTKKAGSVKKFGTFIQMLLQALRKEKEIVYIDLLTFQDLLLLKASKEGTTTDVKAIPASKNSNKRYLILTYVAEFDHVHYPLNLCYEDTPPLAILQRTISRLSQELTNCKRMSMSQSDMSYNGGGTQSEFFQQTNSFELVSVMSENQELKKEIKKLQVDSDDEETDDEFREKLRIKIQIQKENQKLKEDYAALTKELESANKAIDQKKLELRNTKHKYFSIQNNEEFTVSELTQSQAQIKRQLAEMKEKLEEQREMGGKAIQEQEGEKSKLEKELEEAKDNELKLRTRMKELENQITSANAKIDELTMGGKRRSTRSNSYQRNISPATSQKSRSSRPSPGNYRNSYNRPITLKNYTPPGARQNSQGRSQQRVPLYMRSSPGSGSSLPRNNKYSPGVRNGVNKYSPSPAAKAAGVVPGPRRVPNGQQARASPGSSVFDRLYSKSKRTSSKEASPSLRGREAAGQVRGRSKEAGLKGYGSNQDIKPMLQRRGAKPQANIENEKPNQRGKGNVMEGISQRLEALQKMISNSKS